MNTTNYPSGSPQIQPPRKSFKSIVIGLLAAGLLGTGAYAIYSGSSHQSEQQIQQIQIARFVDEKGQLQKKFDESLVRLDSIVGVSNKMQDVLSGRQKDISRMKVEIRKILKKEKLTELEKKQAQDLLIELNQKINNMEAEVARLTHENQNLNEDKTKLTQDKDKLASDLQTTSTAKVDLEKKVDIASTLFATHITITPVQDKKNGEEKLTDKAKKVDKLIIAFDVANRIAISGQTDIFVCITGPDGKLISVPALGSGTFTTRDEGDKIFTSKLPVEFEAGKVKSLQFSWKQETVFESGMYKIEIYHNGFKIGEGLKELKKGGLFS
ncbi:MAG: hypothetical protein ACHQEM_05565 [Chitinophagales bacterium]